MRGTCVDEFLREERFLTYIELGEKSWTQQKYDGFVLRVEAALGQRLIWELLGCLYFGYPTFRIVLELVC